MNPNVVKYLGRASVRGRPTVRARWEKGDPGMALLLKLSGGHAILFVVGRPFRGELLLQAIDVLQQALAGQHQE
ncbi:hypothetical protein BRDID11002_28520 [Bradyrhizobium diazoefficiens]